MDPLVQVQSMWQFAATCSGLRFLSRFIKLSLPQPSLLENAILNPVEHVSVLANVHGRLLGLAQGDSCRNKWIPTLARFMNKYLHVFQDVLVKDNNMISYQQQQDDDNDDVLVQLIPKDMDQYIELDVIKRLRILHTLVDLIISDTDLSPVSGNLKERQIDDMPTAPIGVDMLGNSYWYFDDQERVYRQPGKKTEQGLKSKKEEIDTIQKEEQIRLKKEEKEKKKKQAMENKERIRKQKEERRKKKMERWAPRVSATRTTRASSKAKIQKVEHEPVNEQQSNEQHVMERRTSGRKRKQVVTKSIEDNQQKSKGKRMRMMQLGEDEIQVRKCERWQVVCSGSEQLKQFIDKMKREDGTIHNIEKPLLKVLEEKVIPHMEEYEQRIRRENERKMKSEVVMVVQKRSSRVQAITQRREEQEKLKMEEERLEKEKEEELIRHETEVKRVVAQKRRQISRDIREIRRVNGMQQNMERDEEMVQTILKVEEERRKEIVRRSTRQAKRNSRIVGDEAENEEDTVMEQEKEDVEMEEEKAEASETIDQVEQLEQEQPKQQHTDLGVGLQGSPNGIGSFSSATLEKEIPSDFTWIRNADDNLPTRVLDNFFFALRTDFSDAPLELCDNDSAIVGFGLLIPPTSSPPVVLSVEIPRVIEWVIEYGPEPILWIRSPTAWYQLRHSAPEYKTAFMSARRKFELAARVYIIGEKMRGPQLSYESIISYLGFTYGEMNAYEEEDVLLEKQFIWHQLQTVGRKSLLQSGFMRTLQNRIKAEDRDKAKKEQLKKNKVEGRKSGKTTRSVPTAVSSIVTNILRNATKSNEQKSIKMKKEKKEKSVAISNGSTDQHSNQPVINSSTTKDDSDTSDDKAIAQERDDKLKNGGKNQVVVKHKSSTVDTTNVYTANNANLDIGNNSSHNTVNLQNGLNSPNATTFA